MLVGKKRIRDTSDIKIALSIDFFSREWSSFSIFTRVVLSGDYLLATKKMISSRYKWISYMDVHSLNELSDLLKVFLEIGKIRISFSCVFLFNV